MTYENEQRIKEESVFTLPKLTRKWWDMASAHFQDGVIVYCDRVIIDRNTRHSVAVLPADEITGVRITKSGGFGASRDVHLYLNDAMAVVGYATQKIHHVARGLAPDDAEALATVIREISRNLVQAE